MAIGPDASESRWGLLLVGASAERRAGLHRQLELAASAEWMVEEAVDLDSAIPALESGRFAVALLALDATAVDGAAAVRAARAAHPAVAVVVHLATPVATADNDGLVLDQCSSLVAAGAEDCFGDQDVSPSLLARSLRFARLRHEWRRASVGEDEMTLRRRYHRVLASVARRGSRTRLTAASYGLRSLRKQAPQEFAAWVESYRSLLDLALEERTHKVDNGVDEKLQQMATELGGLYADPRDIVELHTAAISPRRAGVPRARQSALWEEGRLLTLKLMGYLARYYRARALQFSRWSADAKALPTVSGAADAGPRTAVQ